MPRLSPEEKHERSEAEAVRAVQKRNNKSRFKNDQYYEELLRTPRKPI